MYVCGDTSPPYTAGEGKLINRPPKNGECSEKNHDRNCDSPPTIKTEKNRRESGERCSRHKHRASNRKHANKLFCGSPPAGGLGGALLRVRRCGSERTRSPRRGLRGDNQSRPDWAAYHTREPRERATNRQNKAASANDHKNPRNDIRKNMCRHERGACDSRRRACRHGEAQRETGKATAEKCQPNEAAANAERNPVLRVVSSGKDGGILHAMARHAVGKV